MKQPFRIPVSYFIAISASGAGIGILVGLSTSPVVNALLASILTLVAGVLGAVCGVRLEQGERDVELTENASDDENRDQGRLEWNAWPFAIRVNPVPLGFLVVAIVIGSLVGLYARTHEWFAESPKHLVEKWQKSTDLSTQEIARRLFDSVYGTSKGEPKTAEANNVVAKSILAAALPKMEDAKRSDALPIHAGILFDVKEEMCQHLRTLDPKELRLELQGLGYPNIKEFVSRCKDDRDLQSAFDLLICPKGD